MRSRHHTESSTRPFDGQLAPLIHFEVSIDGKSVILQCNFSPVRHFRLFEKGNLVKTILASHVHEVYQDPNTSTQIMLSLDFSGSSFNLTKKKLVEMGTSLTLKVDSTSVNERDRMWLFLKALVDDDYELACTQYHWPNVPTLKEGPSKKKGKHLGGHAIWLVLHPGRLLLFKKQSDEVPSSVLLLTEVTVEAAGETSIVIHLRSRTYELSFGTAQEAEEWRISISCEIDLTTQLRPQNLPKRIAKPKTASISTKFDLSGALEGASTDRGPNACGLTGCINLKDTGIDFCTKHANLQAKKIEKEEAAKIALEKKIREEEEQLRLKLLEEATNNPIFWKMAIETESGERFYYNQAAKISQYARPMCLIQQDKQEAMNWSEIKDLEGRRAWHNIKTGITTKVRPECLGRDPIMSHWKEAFSETGEKYWYNKQLMQSTYDNPFLEELKRQERELLEAPACPPAHQDPLKRTLEEQQVAILNLTAQLDQKEPPPPYAESQATISNLNKQVSDKTLSIQSLTKELGEAQNTIQQLTTELGEAHQMNQQLIQQVTEQQITISQLQTKAPESPPPSHRRQLSVSLTQKLTESQNMIASLKEQLAESQKQNNAKLSESQAIIASLKEQLAEARKQTKDDSVKSPKHSPTNSMETGDSKTELTSRLDRLEEQNRQLMQLLQSQNQPTRPLSPNNPPAREPPSRPAPRAKAG